MGRLVVERRVASELSANTQFLSEIQIGEAMVRLHEVHRGPTGTKIRVVVDAPPHVKVVRKELLPSP